MTTIGAQIDGETSNIIRSGLPVQTTHSYPILRLTKAIICCRQTVLNTALFPHHRRNNQGTYQKRTMVDRTSRFFSASFLVLALVLLLSIVINPCSANIGGWARAGAGAGAAQSWRRKNEINSDGKPNPFASGLQRALSQSIVGTSKSKLNKHVSDEDESRAIRTAFIDDSDQAKDIQYTMKPHLKHATSSEPDASTVVQASTTVAVAPRSLLFWESMVSGAVSRSIAQTVMHPANTMKTIMQSSRGPSKPKLMDLIKPQMFRRLTCGAGANFVLSLPHGAFNFAVLESIREKMSTVVDSVPVLERNKERIGPGLDFLSSSIATICCSVVSTPQMMITDNIMAGNYPNLVAATNGLYSNGGMMGFYSGWWPGLVGKIPSYALTWTFFQQIKRVRNSMSNRPAKNYENTIMGCMASATTVCIMIPMDTIKTRLVTQTSAKVLEGQAYKGIVDCGVRIAKEEGIKTFYRGLAPRLLSVVPMIGIQFGVYEAMKKVMLQRSVSTERVGKGIYGEEEVIEEAAMETAASQGTAFPAPHFLKYRYSSKVSKRS